MLDVEQLLPKCKKKNPTVSHVLQFPIRFLSTPSFVSPNHHLFMLLALRIRQELMNKHTLLDI